MKTILIILLVAILLIQAQTSPRNLQIRPPPGRRGPPPPENNDTSIPPPFQRNHTHNQTHGNRSDFNRSADNIQQNGPEGPPENRPQGNRPPRNRPQGNRPPRSRRGSRPQNRPPKRDRSERNSTEFNETQSFRGDRNQTRSNEGGRRGNRRNNRVLLDLSDFAVACESDEDCSAAFPFVASLNIEILCDVNKKRCTRWK